MARLLRHLGEGATLVRRPTRLSTGIVLARRPRLRGHPRTWDGEEIEDVWMVWMFSASSSDFECRVVREFFLIAIVRSTMRGSRREASPSALRASFHRRSL